MEEINSPDVDLGFAGKVAPSETSGTDARVSASDQAALISVARNFFIFGTLVVVVVALPLIYHFDFRQCRGLVWLAGIAALVGWAGSFIVGRRVRANPASGDVGLTNRFVENWGVLAVFVAFLALYSSTMYAPTPFNAHVIQAYSFLHGHTWIDLPPCCIEHAPFNGKFYQLHPPLPSMLLVPFVAIWGNATNQNAASVTIAAVSVALAWLMLGRMKFTLNARVWLTIFFGAGTIIWHEATDGGSWEVTMVVAVAFTMVALAEYFGDARPTIIGFGAGLAALARYDLALVWPIWMLLTYLKRPSLRELRWLAPGFALAAVIYVVFNEVRYGSIFDRSIFLFAPDNPHKFSVTYLPFNLFTLLFMSPAFNQNFPYLHPGGSGQALILTSPAFVLAFRPSFRSLVPSALLVAAVISIIPSLFYFTNGFVQFGTHHYVHAFPFLFALVALGLPGGKMDQLTRVLIAYSVLLIAYGVLHIMVVGYG
jgi:hypothetical protein